MKIRLVFFIAAAIATMTAATAPTAQTFSGGQVVTVTGQLTLSCNAMLTRLRQEWHTRGEGVNEVETSFGMTSSGSGLSGSFDQSMSDQITANETYKVPIKVGTRVGKDGSATIVTTFWYSGDNCSDQRTVGSFIEVVPGN